MRCSRALVLGGREGFLPGHQHTIWNVYPIMLRQICRDYGSLPDPRTLTLGEIRFFYDALRGELMKTQKSEIEPAQAAKRSPKRVSRTRRR